jgi:hypothetical protein
MKPWSAGQERLLVVALDDVAEVVVEVATDGAVARGLRLFDLGGGVGAVVGG